MLMFELAYAILHMSFCCIFLHHLGKMYEFIVVKLSNKFRLMLCFRMFVLQK